MMSFSALFNRNNNNNYNKFINTFKKQLQQLYYNKNKLT